MPAGRPIEYKEDIILAKAQEYLDSCEDIEYQQIRTEGDKSTSYENKVRVKLPTIEGLANYLGIHRDTVYAWESTYPLFSDIIQQLRQDQADKLINNGLSGDYNSVIAKVLLTKHGYREGIEQTGKDGGALIPDADTKDQVDKALAAFINENNQRNTQGREAEGPASTV